MTQFFHRVGPRTSAVRQVWLLALLAVTATVLVLTLMDSASRQVRATSEKLSETQEAMHKMAVSLDMRLSDAQNEQGAWLSGRTPSRDDTTIKLEESLAERFSQVRSAPHLASISTNLMELEESVRDIKRLTEACREWHHNHSNNVARLHATKTNASTVLQRLTRELVQFESRFQIERQADVQRLLALSPGTAASQLAQNVLKHDGTDRLVTKVQDRLNVLRFLLEHIYDEETAGALVPYRDSLLPEATRNLMAALEELRSAEQCTADLIQAIDQARSTLPSLLHHTAGSRAAGTNAAADDSSLYALCLRRIELEGLRLVLLQQSSDRVGEIRFNGVDLQIGFNTLQREASMAASLAMQRTGQRLLWFGASIGFVLLILAFRIAGTLREQLNTIQRNSAELDRAATEAKAAADSLGRSEQRTRLILDTAMDAVVSMDERGRITGWNKQAEQTFGWSSAEASGRTLADLIIPERMRRAHVEGFQRFLRTGVAKVLNQRLEVPALRKDGTEIPVELTVTPITYAGQVTFNAFLRDISERKQAEHEVLCSKERVEAVNKELQASLETAERLTVEAQSASTAKSEFLATMSHEIRTPMNGILGFTDLLIDTPLNEEQRDYLSTIKSSADSLLAIINDILDFSKVEAGKMQLDASWFDLGVVATDVTRLLFTQAATRKLSLNLNCGELRLPRIFADPSRVRQVLLNLTGNAIKFTEKGSVTIRVEPEPSARSTDTTSTAYVRVSVTDTGIGIPIEKQAQVFEKFVQADSSHSRRYGGTGLGLAICKSLVELMGGTIGFESRPGHGSTFWFTLVCEKPVEAGSLPADGITPLFDDEPAKNNGAPAVTLKLNERDLELLAGRRVLLAEDNRANQRLVSTLLRKMRCEVDIVNNGRESVLKVREQEYSLVLMDCHMPDMDGFEATAEIRKWEAASRASRRLPIVALTASLMDDDKHRCKLAGMDDFLGKPIQLEELTRAIKQWAVYTDDSLKAP
jgi:PAS domain S-box-containing protein